VIFTGNIKVQQMKKTIQILLIFMISGFQAGTQNSLPTVTSGKIERIEQFRSKYVTPRNIDIWLPEGYSDSLRYAVLYMHDGQMLYDPAITWNQQAWNVDDVAAELLLSGRVRPFIVVGIWNSGEQRYVDYFPRKPFIQLPESEKDTVLSQLRKSGRTDKQFKPRSDSYLKFLVTELKPYIDKTYPVYTNPENTFVTGSSMGGLISIYAVCEYPGVFGGAACLSTHWPGTFTLENNPMPNAFISYLSQKLPNPETHKFYFDTGDQTIDALYPPVQKQVDSLMMAKGFSERNWITRYFYGDDHSENAWNRRLHIPLKFLFKN
jgi:predicted alpha/beta superfamily hydrolase